MASTHNQVLVEIIGHKLQSFCLHSQSAMVSLYISMLDYYIQIYIELSNQQELV